MRMRSLSSVPVYHPEIISVHAFRSEAKFSCRSSAGPLAPPIMFLNSESGLLRKREPECHVLALPAMIMRVIYERSVMRGSSTRYRGKRPAYRMSSQDASTFILAKLLEEQNRSSTRSPWSCPYHPQMTGPFVLCVC